MNELLFTTVQSRMVQYEMGVAQFREYSKLKTPIFCND